MSEENFNFSSKEIIHKKGLPTSNIAEPAKKQNKWLLWVLLGIVTFLIIAVVLVLVFKKEESAPTEVAETTEAVKIDFYATFYEQGADEAISQYSNVIKQEKNDAAKAELYIERARALDELCGAECAEQILNDVYSAEEANPTDTTAWFIGIYEQLYGDIDKAREYFDIYEKRNGTYGTEDDGPQGYLENGPVALLFA